MDPEDYSDLLADLAPRLGTEIVPAHEAIERTTAGDVAAAHGVPAFPTSAMDGFALDRQAWTAVRRGDMVPVIGDVPAGHHPVPLRRCSAVRVMTGAPVPTGAEVVVPVEFTDARPTGSAPQSIRVASVPPSAVHGWNIRSVGEDIAAGELVVPSGSRLTAAGVGTLAMLGLSQVEVQRRPRVGLIVTGDELCTGGSATPEPGTEAADSSGPTIRNSNLPMLSSAISALGCEPVEATCGDDTTEFLTILRGMEDTVDLAITTGGISAGAFEVVRQALEGEHSTFIRLGMRPGAPQGFGRFGSLPLLHFPGTPQGAFLSFHLFVRSLLTGHSLRERWTKRVYQGPDLAEHPRAVTFGPGAFTAGGEVRDLGRTRLQNFAIADVIARIPRGTGTLAAGTIIDCLDI
ncbi:molybdopterin molybdotransferase MoeA [Brevibacterium atlanticum]|uniref:molybdopterin molybdotransferase MoeA n=1 Tax=Brevibacterium atlanticum TaxID=2697563 RepID=UPI0014249C8A|nr:molybdopterin molybdotransferase MoeA [Brevibacterium atlanticum]